MQVLFATLLLAGPQVSTDARRDFYPAPPLESRHSLRLPLPNGASLELVAGGKVEAGGKVVCWDAKGVVDRALSRRFEASYRTDKSIARRMPKGEGHRFLVYRFHDLPTLRELRAQRWHPNVGGNFVSPGKDLSARLMPFASRAETLSLYVDVVWNKPIEKMLPRAGETRHVGRGTVTIEEIRERKHGITEILASTKGETYESLMFDALDAKGKPIGPTDMNGDPLPPGAKPVRAGMGMGINTLGMRPGNVAVALRHIDRLSLYAPYVRRYLVYGIPANPRRG